MDYGFTMAAYAVATVLFVLALGGLSNQEKAKRAVWYGIVGMAVAVLATMVGPGSGLWVLSLVLIALGGLVGWQLAARVKMTQMPQLVALFNGVGGGAAGLVALLELEHSTTVGAFIAVAFTVLVGGIAFSGSVVTFLKLQELMPTRPIIFAGHAIVIIALLIAGLAAATIIVLDDAVLSSLGLADARGPAAFVGLVIGLALGVLLVLPVGGHSLAGLPSRA